MLPFEESRRLLGPGLWLDAPGAVLEAPVEWVTDDALARWRARTDAMIAGLGWPRSATVVRRHAGGVSLAIEAPLHALLTATEVNEWAWLGALSTPEPWPTPLGPGGAVHDLDGALPLMQFLARTEMPASLGPLVAQAAAFGTEVCLDDDALTVGQGRWSRTWPLDALPEVAEVPWPDVRGIPVALVTGSNGKTTTARLIAAMCRSHGWVSGLSSTDGVHVAGETIEEGDWAGPAGARLVIRDRRTEAAVLETARGGMLRRGLAVTGARAAVITNVQSDHFGEYGIDDLAALAQVKLAVRKALAAEGTLVLNADDPQLVAGSAVCRGRIAWFSLRADSPVVARAREQGAVCAVRDADGVLRVLDANGAHALVAEHEAPLAAQGRAAYNVANMLAASLAAHAMGVGVPEIVRVLASFGASRDDNPGRLSRWDVAGATVLLDYAHNPDGLAGLLDVARPMCAPQGRLLLLLGQAGNREDSAIRALARTAAAAQPAVIAVKELVDFLRGRALGEVPAILRAELIEAGFSSSAVRLYDDETDAAKALVEQARAGDVVVLPVHGRAARHTVSAWLDARAAGR